MVQTYKFKFLNSTFFAFYKMDQGIITHTKRHRLNSILVSFLISHSFFNHPKWADEFSVGKGRGEISSLTHKRSCSASPSTHSFYCTGKVTITHSWISNPLLSISFLSPNISPMVLIMTWPEVKVLSQLGNIWQNYFLYNRK